MRRSAAYYDKRYMAFGDDYADIGMLRLYGKGVAMGNAIDDVNGTADVVIGGNDDDGIAEYLERFLINEGERAR